DREKLAALIEHLAADEYQAREEASAQIVALGPRVVPDLEAALAGARDQEVVERLRRAIETLRRQVEERASTRARVLALLALVRMGSEASVPVVLHVLGREEGTLARAADFALRGILLDGPEPPRPGPESRDAAKDPASAADWKAFLEARPERPGERASVPGSLPEGLEVRAESGDWMDIEIDVDLNGQPGEGLDGRRLSMIERMEIVERVLSREPLALSREYRTHLFEESPGFGTGRVSRAGRTFRVEFGESGPTLREEGGGVLDPSQSGPDMGILGTLLLPPGDYGRGAERPASDRLAAMHRLIFDWREVPASKVEVETPGRVRYLGDDPRGRALFGYLAALQVVSNLGQEGIEGRFVFWFAGSLAVERGTGRVTDYRFSGPFFGEFHGGPAGTDFTFRSGYHGDVGMWYREIEAKGG
ncbi:MAG: hypothetical protein HY720_28330, partial [Planctomycetes bacterium]|nr:hypothetical protein [Planctomycetota bacterium]